VDSDADVAVYVHQDYHRLRVGGHLLEVAIDLASEAEIGRRRMQTGGENDAMLTLAFGHGFGVTGRAAGQVELSTTVPEGRERPAD
jgi:GNAT superfamily N-acetyltransferase